MVRAIAPGKLILSGEHAVVYGKPALVMAVNRFAKTVIREQEALRISLSLPDLDQSHSVAPSALPALKKRLLKKYRLFTEGELGIRKVLAQPYELFEFVIIKLIEDLQLTLATGLRIELTSELPIGSGMGSSAATIACLVRALAHSFHLEFDLKRFYDLCLEAEKLLHGNPSGVDPYISLHGGFVRFQQQKALPLTLPELPMFLVHTGNPQTSTGECVSQVAKYFHGSAIWDQFESITNDLEKALTRSQGSRLKKLIRENHRLLYTIGVVPERVADFISEIETHGGAAKISGAGSVSGDSAGMVIVFANQNPEEICQNYGYSIIPIQGEPKGARIL